MDVWFENIHVDRNLWNRILELMETWMASVAGRTSGRAVRTAWSRRWFAFPFTHRGTVNGGAVLGTDIPDLLRCYAIVFCKSATIPCLDIAAVSVVGNISILILYFADGIRIDITRAILSPVCQRGSVIFTLFTAFRSFVVINSKIRCYMLCWI